MKIVKKIIVGYILFILLFCSDFLQAQCTCTESPGSLNANQLVLCENFESYTNGSSFPFNNARWTFWPGTGTSARIQTAPNSNSKALLVQNNGFSSPDLLLKLGNRTTGRYRLSWQMYIPKGKTAHYSIQHAESAERWAYEVDFENGIGTLSRFGLPVTKFPYIIGGWNKVMQIIDITSDQVELWINDEYVDSWRYNTGRAPEFSYIFGTYPLAAINFKGATNASYYVDNICLWQATPALPSNVGPTCIKNGESISGGESIIKNYNLYTEREYSNENCRNICSFAGLNVKNSLKYDNQNRVPASRIDNASILPNQVINLPCLKDRILTQKSLRGQIYPFTATTTDLSIELQFQVGFAGNIQIALVECNENLNFPCQLDENTDGLSFYFKVQPGKTYNIIVIATEPVEFLIDISTVVGPKICTFINEDLGAPCICKEATTTLSQATTLTNIRPSDLSATKRVFPEINRDYLGGEKAFRITLERPSLVNFSLKSTNQGYSMFLAGSDCADNLLALNSTPDNGGTATISKALEAGVYHLIVDQLTTNSSNFQLTYTFSAIDPVSRASNSACPIIPNNAHQISIRSSPLLLNTDVLGINDRIYLVNTRNINNRETNASNWGGQQINFTLYEDAPSDNLNCGYVDGDLFEFVIIRQDKIYSVKPIFQLEDGIEITAGNKFKKGGKSLITGFVSTLNVSNLGVGSIPTLSANERIFVLEVNSTGAWRIQRVNPNKPAWIEFNLTNSSGIRDVSFKVFRNQSTQARTDTVLVINDQGFYKSIVITQPGCTGPSINAGVDQSICAGQKDTLTASGVGIITWENPGLVSNPRLITPTLNATQTFTAYATINGCTASDQVTVNVLPKPNANAGADTSICAGFKAVLSARGGGAYTWSNGATSPKLEVSPTTTTTYTLTVTSQGCTATDQVVVVVNRASANAGTDRSICRGDSTTLQASGGGTYLWSNGKTSPSFKVSPTSDQIYQVTVSNNNCTATAAVKVTVNPLPLANAGADTSICAGFKAVLSARGGGAYTWSNGATSPKLEVNPTTTTTYTLTVTSQSGCTATDQVVVVVNRTSASASADRSSICRGDSTTLQASGGGTYLWSNGKTSPSFKVSPTSDQVYQVTVSNNNCTATAAVKVTVNPLPLANAGADTSICAGFKAVLSARGGGAYTWSNGATSPKLEVSPTTTTTYTLTVTSQGCTATDQVVVVVNRTSANAGTDRGSICRGDSTTLQASGGGTYLWSNGKTSPSIKVSPASDQIYQVTVSNNNCPATATVKVTVNPLPLANAGADTSICKGQSAMLTASGGNSYKWSNSTQTPTITVTPASTETFTVTVTSQNGCEASDQLTVTVRPLPRANAGADTSICAGQRARLTASGGSTYKWSNNTNLSSITVMPASTETFTVTVTAQNGCEASDQLTVTVRPLPLANAGPDQPICSGSEAVLSASGGGTYTWSNGSTTTSLKVSPTTTTTYTLTVTSQGCTATDQVVVVVNRASVSAGTDRIICRGDSTTLQATGGGTYLWSNGKTSPSIKVSPTSDQVYQVTVSDNNCPATATVKVTVNPLPLANAGADTSICKGQSAMLTASGGNSYKWSNSTQTPTITVTPASTETFTVTVTAQNGCEASDQLTVTVRPLPIASAGPDQSICTGESARLTASGGSSYKWSNGTQTPAITVTPVNTTTFTVTVTQNGCDATDQLTVTVRPLPVANAGPDQSICAGQSAVLTASGGSSYKWSNNATTASITISPIGTQIFSVKVIQNGCEASDEVLLTVKPLPSANAGPDQSICVGQEAVLNASGGSNYKWSNNASTARITIRPIATQIFTVTVTQEDCVASDEMLLTVKPLPVANAGPDQSICVGQTAVLNATGGSSYKWNTNASTSAITINPTTTQTYSVTVTQNECEAVDRVTITVNSNPSIKKDSSQFKAGVNSFIAVSVSGGKAPYQYQWFRNDTLVSVQEDLLGVKSGIHKLIVTDAIGCSAILGPQTIVTTSTIDPTLNRNIQIFPNPSNALIHIQFDLEQATPLDIIILDGLGKNIWHQNQRNFFREKLEVNLSNHPAGMYWVQFKTENGAFYKKIMRL